MQNVSHNGPVLSAFDQPPTVNVIKSNAAKVVSSMTQSIEATDGDTVKKGSTMQNIQEGGILFQTFERHLDVGQLNNSTVVQGEDNFEFLISG